MKSSGSSKILKEISETRKQQDESNDLSKTSASTLKKLLDNRKSRTSQHDARAVKDSLSMEDMVNFLQESDLLAKNLKEQILFYQDSLAGLRQRTEQLVSENELLYEKIKENQCFSAAPARNYLTVKLGEKEDRRYLYQLQNELDEVKRLNQDKTSHLETIIQSTKKELNVYRERVTKLQSQLRSFHAHEMEPKHDNICVKCGGFNYFSSSPSEAQINTLATLASERDELADMLAKHKSLLVECHQREFEAYMEVKKSAETAENAKLEKAEAIIKIKQLESSFEEERKRHDLLISSANEKWKQECDEIKEKYKKEKHSLHSEIQVLTQKCDENEHQLDKITREKVNLISDAEKLKMELSASRADVEKVKEDAKNEGIAMTREHSKAEQELQNLQNIHAQELREHEQLKMSLTCENEGLRQRLTEAQSSWLKTREETLKTEERLKQLENELHLTTLSKNNLETAYDENRAFLKKQDEQREQQFIESLQETERTNAELRQELEEILQTQMKMSSAIKDENKRLLLKMEEKKESHRSEKTKWREQLGQLTNELETTRKQLYEMTSEKENLCQRNEELAAKVKLLKKENKKSLKMVYNLLKKQKDLMQDRQMLSHELEYLQRSQIACTPLHPGHQVSEVAGNIAPNEQESGGDTSCKSKPSNVDVNNGDESL